MFTIVKVFANVVLFALLGGATGALCGYALCKLFPSFYRRVFAVDDPSQSPSADGTWYGLYEGASFGALYGLFCLWI